jgi:hypothetical protein
VPSSPTSATTTGRITSAIDGTGIAGASVRLSGATVKTDGAGNFSVTVPAGAQRATITTDSGHVERQTSIAIPGPHAVLSLIPASLDLAAFDQMVRSTAQLTRWTRAPALVIQTRVLTFTALDARDAMAETDRMAQAEIDAWQSDLTAALKTLTAGRFSAFASIAVETAAPGQRVTLQRSNQIVVAPFRGLTSSGNKGYAQWATLTDGTVTAAVMMLDRDFDISSSPFRRSLRMHELGHALGYNHVTGQRSVMNAEATNTPTGFDTQVVAIAFQRAPGNRSPDIDPDGYSANLVAGTLRWTGLP